MRKDVAGLIAALTVMAISSSAYASKLGNSYALPAQYKHDIVTQIKDRLLDGESARWRWPKYIPNAGGYCGFFNAKNRMGAYTGFKTYFLIGFIIRAKKAKTKFDVFDVTFPTDDEEAPETALVHRQCADNGYDPASVPQG